ncbi:Uncharacterised protein [Streptococcus milleri]|uniref:DUF4276 family protein n=1 Tax=Streptococcus milleri TaxID=33040 RepID=A0A380L1V3_9STRE|nr:hypothetical protein [Streptococcus milleri]SUN80087.1 Uncharacterised protein [Streptococcus milleri]
MNKKEEKVFLIFVEGSTDADCLDPIVDEFKQKLNLSDITIRVQNGDIFTLHENDSKTGANILKDQVLRYLSYSKLSASQIVHVAFVTDTDGAFINPNDYIIDSTVDAFEYDLLKKKILFVNPAKRNSIQRSRQTKARKIISVIRELSESSLTVDRKKLAYSIHYNSINLEHVLFDNILPNEAKTAAVDDLLDEIGDDPYQMRAIFEGKALGEDYMDSWRQIRNLEMDQGYTNLHILFQILASFERK